MTLCGDRFLVRFQSIRRRIICRTNSEPVVFIQISQIILGDLAALGDLLRATVDGLADQHFFQTLEGIAYADTHLNVQVQTKALQLYKFERQTLREEWSSQCKSRVTANV